MNDIEINEEFTKAINLFEDPEKSVIFVTGKAGTGKSTLLRHYIENSSKNIAVLAPTGVSALNVQGQTVHSFFKFKPTTTISKIRSQKKPTQKMRELLNRLDMIIIDEISMVRADLLDLVDESLRKNLNSPLPFGGKKMVFIGDLFQLPPVVSSQSEKELFRTFYSSPYFFDAKVMSKVSLEILELEKVYRQHEGVFIDILNKIRTNTVEDEDLEILNERNRVDESEIDPDKFYITLTTTNASADRINQIKLNSIPGEEKSYPAAIDGKFDFKSFPTAENLSVKKGSQVMLLNNDPMGRWVNGTVGKITDIYFDGTLGEDILEIKDNDGKYLTVSPHTWEIFSYTIKKETGKIDAEKIGSFTQYPIRLAWAVTIHKSQGKTFDNVIVDMGLGAFAQGQVYVAISRATNLNGLLLKRPIQKRHIWTDQRIIDFLYTNNFTQSERTAGKLKQFEDFLKEKINIS